MAASNFMVVVVVVVGRGRRGWFEGSKKKVVNEMTTEPRKAKKKTTLLSLSLVPLLCFSHTSCLFFPLDVFRASLFCFFFIFARMKYSSAVSSSRRKSRKVGIA